jgi:hypothetical protein
MNPVASSGSGGGSSGTSGSGGIGGLGSSASQPTAADRKAGAADASKSKLNTNILSGYDGGGGGGGSRGGGGSSSNKDSQYNAYLPGGAKDPSRGIASKTFANGEITGSGSKSNWEKVHERYTDNKPTLLGK